MELEEVQMEEVESNGAGASPPSASASKPPKPHEETDESKKKEEDVESDVEIMSDGNMTEGEKGGEERTAPNPVPVSLSGTPTPSSSDTLRTPTNTPTSASKKRKRLTPDERAAKEKERAEKRQKLEDEKRKKEQERLEKLRAKELERQEKERQKELEKQKRDEEKRKKDEAKEEEKRKKDEEIAKKAEEKRKKEEERLKKEEEKRKIQEEKEKEKQREEEKKAKQASLFTKFFQKAPAPVSKVKTYNAEQSVRPRAVETVTGDPESDKENSTGNEIHTEKMKTEVIEDGDNSAEVQIVMVRKPEAPKFCPFPFQIKSNMFLAPLLRRTPLTSNERKYLDGFLKESPEEISDETDKNDGESNVVSENKWKSELIQRVERKETRKTGRTLLSECINELDKDVNMLTADGIRPPEVGCKRYRIKLLQFKENRRPAYWGTYKKKPVKVKAKNPLIKEDGIDYEFDSDDEWEDEPEDGEEIENSEGEEEGGAEDPGEGEPADDDDEEGWMVPHGYLSDNEREGVEMDLDMVKTKEKEFFKSLKEKVKLGIPVIQTENLGEFTMLLPPKFLNRKPRRSDRPRKVANEQIRNPTKGFLALELPSDDEEDGDWRDEPEEVGEDAEGDVSSDEDSDEDYDSLSESEIQSDQSLIV